MHYLIGTESIYRGQKYQITEFIELQISGTGRIDDFRYSKD